MPDTRQSLVQRIWNTAVDIAYLLQTYAERLFYWTVRHRDMHQYEEKN